MNQDGLRLHTLDNLSVVQSPKKVKFQNLCYEDQRGLAVYNVIQLNQHGLRLHTLDNLSVVHAPKKMRFQNLCYEYQCGLKIRPPDPVFFCYVNLNTVYAITMYIFFETYNHQND